MRAEDREHARAGLSAPTASRSSSPPTARPTRPTTIVRRVRAARPPGPAPRAARQGSGAAARHRGRVGRDPDLLRRRHRAGARRRLEHRRATSPTRPSAASAASIGSSTPTAASAAKAPTCATRCGCAARDPRQQPGRPQRIVLRGAPRRLPAVGRRSPERLQHAAERRRDGTARRARSRDRRLLPEHRRRSARVRAKDANRRPRHRRARRQRADAESVSLRAVRVAAGEPQAVPLARAVRDDHRAVASNAAARLTARRSTSPPSASSARSTRGRARRPLDAALQLCESRRFLSSPTSAILTAWFRYARGERMTSWWMPSERHGGSPLKPVPADPRSARRTTPWS